MKTTTQYTYVCIRPEDGETITVGKLMGILSNLNPDDEILVGSGLNDCEESIMRIIYNPNQRKPGCVLFATEQDEEPETEPDVEMELAEIESESGETLFVSPDAKPLDGKRIRAFVTVKIPGYYAKRVTWEDGANLVLFRESDDADQEDPYDVPDMDAITFTDDGKPALWFFRDGRNIKIELEVVSRRPNRVAHTF